MTIIITFIIFPTDEALKNVGNVDFHNTNAAAAAAAAGAAD